MSSGDRWTGCLWSGAGGQNRTADLRITSASLYRLSYTSISKLGSMERVRGIEPPSKAWEAFVLPLNYTRLSEKSPSR